MDGQLDALLAYTLAADAAKRAGEDEKLLEYQPPPRKLKRVKILGKVDVFISVGGLRKAAALAHVLREHVRDAVKAGVQPLAHGLQHRALVEPIAHAVDRDDAPGDGAAAGRLFVHGVHHGAAHAGGFYFPEEHIALAADEIVLCVGLIEECYVNRAALVDGAQLHKLKPAAHAGQARSVGDQRLDADALTAACQRDGHNGAAILVFTRKIRNKVIERKDAELCKRLRLFLSYALDVSDVGIQVGHYSVYLRV